MKLNEISDVKVIDRPKTVSKEKEKVDNPMMYEVLLHNDNEVWGPYVADILRRFFNKEIQAAMKVMMDAHTSGTATVGVYPKDVAETKVDQATLEDPPIGKKITLSVEPIG